jgi:hypothetical protein
MRIVLVRKREGKRSLGGVDLKGAGSKDVDWCMGYGAVEAVVNTAVNFRLP